MLTDLIIALPFEDTLGSLWAVEYSHAQQAFHVQPLPDAVRNNLRAYIANPGAADNCDYQILVITATRDDASAVIEVLRAAC